MTSSFRGGEGEPLVLIHGYANTWRVWEPVLPALTERHDVLAPTLCGHFQGEPLADGVEATVGALTGQMTFPQIVVAERSVGGFRELLEADRDGRLRALLGP